MGYKKEDVEFHYNRGRGVPAVNVKHWPDFEEDVDWDEWETEFRDWAMVELEDSLTYQMVWEAAAESCWEDVTYGAEEIFGSHVKVWSEGRSGGWAVVDGLKDFDDWDAIDLGQWVKFEKWAKRVSECMAYNMVSFLYLNLWDQYREGASADGLAIIGS